MFRRTIGRSHKRAVPPKATWHGRLTFIVHARGARRGRSKPQGHTLTVDIVALLAGVAVLAGCTPDEPNRRTDEQVSRSAPSGTLRVGVLTEEVGPSCIFTFCGPIVNDPQIAGLGGMGFEIGRCCLLRTLLSYNGQSTGDGGGILRPDIAADLPLVSEDGLTWTFRIKHGLHYAPPLENTEIVAGDFIRSVERAMSPRPNYIPDDFGTVLDSYTVEYLDLMHLIAGAEEYVQGKSEHISGISAPDPYTLVVHVTKPVGNLPYVLSQPDLGPIPPNPYDPEARFGVAEGHERLYFGYLVASGPYMIEGAEEIDFSKPPAQQIPASGDAPDSLTLVRNPSWDPDTDQLRVAAADRILLIPVSNEIEAQRLVESGVLDLAFNWEAPPDLLDDNPDSNGPRVFTTLSDWVVFASLNLAIPPMDDVHVRRAMNFAVARQPLLRLWDRAGLRAVVATHIGLDSEENNLLLNFDPYHAATGDVDLARREMAKSRYDRNKDGRCDARVCRRLLFIAREDQPAQPKAAMNVAKQLATIGIDVRVEVPPVGKFISTYGSPEGRIPVRLDQWIKDLPSGATYFPNLFGSPRTGVTQGYNASNLGASRAQLRRWGYDVRGVPAVDDRISACLELTFGAQTRCWADLDAYLMTEIVPWIPLVGLSTGRVTSSRVQSFSFDQSAPTPMPSLDQVAIRADVLPEPFPEGSDRIPDIPDGVYRFAITRADVLKFNDDLPRAAVAQNTGAITVSIRDGAFEILRVADHPIFDPIAVGIYRGSEEKVTFEVQRPSFNAISTPPMRWKFDGRTLHFDFIGCGNLNELDPSAPRLCDEIRVLYEANAWVKVD
jgi:peptide/nickel transport system substrate-binding protein